MRTHALLPLWGTALLMSCLSVGPPIEATLNGAPPGELDLGMRDAWDTDVASLSLTVSSAAGLSCFLDDAEVSCGLAAGSPGLEWPPARSGPEESSLVVKRAGEEVARWTLKRTVVDPEVSVCVASGDGEDDGRPLDQCTLLRPFADATLPLAQTKALRVHRATFSAKGRTSLRRVSVISHLDDDAPLGSGFFVKEVELDGRPVTLALDTLSVVSLRGTTLDWRRSADQTRPVTDIAMPAPVRVRIGQRAQLRRHVTLPAGSADLVDWNDGAGVVTLVNALPVRVEAGAPLGLDVAIVPRAEGVFVFAPRLSLREASLVTDRLLFPVTALPAACRLEVRDVVLAEVQVGERRLAKTLVRNTGSTPCAPVRLRALPRWVSSNELPVPAPGQTVEWTFEVEPSVSGAMVALVEVDIGSDAATFADASFRIDVVAK